MLMKFFPNKKEKNDALGVQSETMNKIFYFYFAWKHFTFELDFEVNEDFVFV